MRGHAAAVVASWHSSHGGCSDILWGCSYGSLSNSVDLESSGKCGAEVVLPTKETFSVVAKLSQVS